MSNTSDNNILKRTWVWLLAAAIWLAVYASTIPGLVNGWNSEDYSHCYLILPIIGYMVWIQRDRIASLSGGSPLPGIIALLGSGGLLIVGRLGSLHFFEYVSLWTSLCALVLMALGHRVLRPLWMPFLVGFFMVPLPAFLNKILGLRLRLISSYLSEKMLQLMQIPVYREGNVIDLGVIQLQVVDACSGLRYLWPSILMALLVGWFFLKGPIRRVVLLLLSIPVTIFANAFRIALTGVLTKFIDPSLAEGFFHDFSGWVVYVLSLGVLALCARFLGKGDTGKPAPQSEVSTKSASFSFASWKYGVVASILLVGAFTLQYSLFHQQDVPERKPFHSFPTVIGDWEGEFESLTTPVLKSLGTDDYLNGEFRNPQTGEVIHVLVSWYDKQTVSHAAHAPTSCLVGGGWDIETKGVLKPRGGDGRRFPVTQMVLTQRGQPLISNFWFWQRGRVVVSEWMNKWYLLMDSVVSQRSDGALVRLEMPVLPGRDIKRAQHTLDSFAEQLSMELAPYLPEGYLSREQGL